MKGTCEQIPFYFFLKFMMLCYAGGFLFRASPFFGSRKMEMPETKNHNKKSGRNFFLPDLFAIRISNLIQSE